MRSVLFTATWAIFIALSGELLASDINWGDSFTSDEPKEEFSATPENGLPGVSKNLFDTSGEPRKLCIGGRWVGTAPSGSTSSTDTKWHCVGGVLTSDPNDVNED